MQLIPLNLPFKTTHLNGKEPDILAYIAKVSGSSDYFFYVDKSIDKSMDRSCFQERNEQHDI